MFHNWCGQEKTDREETECSRLGTSGIDATCNRVLQFFLGVGEDLCNEVALKHLVILTRGEQEHLLPGLQSISEGGGVETDGIAVAWPRIGAPLRQDVTTVV